MLDTNSLQVGGDCCGKHEKEGQKTINRATMVLPIEPWRIAEDPERHRKGECRQRADKGKKKKGKKKPVAIQQELQFPPLNVECSACKLVDAFYTTQRDVASVFNFVTRGLWRQDADFLDKFMVRYGRKPKGDEWEKAEVYYYNEACASHPKLATGIVSAAQRKAARKWTSVRWKALIQQSLRPSHYIDTIPIPIREQDYALIESAERDTFRFAFTLHAGRKGARGKEYCIPIKTKDQQQYNSLLKVARGEWKRGEAAIMRERKDRGKGGGPVNKWFLRISYKKKVELSTEADYAALNRGIAYFLVGYASNGERYILDGDDIRAHLKMLQGRRRQHQRVYRHAGSNRKGHGRKRALKPISHLYAKGEWWRETYNQTKARDFTNWCIKNNVVRVYLANFTNIRNDYVDKLEGGKRLWDLIQEWPYYNLQMRVISCLEEAGIEVYQMPAQYITRTCPRCGNVKEEAVISRKYRCEACGYTQHRDVVACMNEMKRGEEMLENGDEGLEKVSFKEKKKREKGSDASA
jgi:ribosomal protein S27AE